MQSFNGGNLLNTRYLIGLFLLLGFCKAQADDEPLGVFLRGEYQKILESHFSLLPHQGTYLMPVSYNGRPNRDVYENVFPEDIVSERGPYVDHLEAEYQISFNVLVNKKIFNSPFDLFIGYTQGSWWQVYNSDWSKPFRDTNYAPEIFLRKVLAKPGRFLGMDLVAYDLGYIHQSNGQIQELSRSWDRLQTRLAFVYGRMILALQLWYRLPEREAVDDNPDLYKYMGYGQLTTMFKFEKSNIGLLYRPGERYHSVELQYSYPMIEGIRFFMKASYGYGTNLIDYNHRSERIGIGVSLANPFNSSKFGMQ